MSKSTQTSSTRACNLRFVNNGPRTVDVLWLTYEGTEQKYASVPTNSQHIQRMRLPLSGVDFMSTSPVPVQQVCSPTLGSRGCFAAATFTTHPWVIRDSDGILGRSVGDTAVIEILPDSSCTVHEGPAKHVCPRPRPTPLHWGTYHTRRTVRGIAIMVAFLS